MTDKKYGVININYTHVPTVGKFIPLTKENWNEVILEEKLKRGDFSQALDVINRIKRA